MSTAEAPIRVLEYDRRNFSDAELIDLYKRILLPRMIEEKMLILLRQGKISKWFSGIGQEAIAVAAASAVETKDYILPLHRNLGVFTTRGVALHKLFAQWQGKMEGFTQGRDRSFHFGSPEDRIIGMISHLGAMLPVADGIALAGKLDNDNLVSLVFSGDGGASEGDFHEAINVAAVWDLPVIFLIENNGYGLSTPSREQFRLKSFADKAIGYGIDGYSVDGNNILDVYDLLRTLVPQVRENKKPIIVEAMTFRMRGHEEASGTKYVPKELMEAWAKKDPINNYESWLIESGVLSTEEVEGIRKEFKSLINSDWKKAEGFDDITPNLEKEVREIFAPSPTSLIPPGSPSRDLRFVDAVKEGLEQSMEKDDSLVIMGQDIAEYGGVFKITDGFVDKFGRERVRNTPICESAILGAGLGLSIRNRPSVVEMQFADFVSCGFNQIANNLAKTHYRWGVPVSVTVRMPTGAGVGAGPFHSQSNEAWFSHIPGLKVVYPSNPHDAKGLLTSSILEPNPVMFFEHKYLYRSTTGPVPEAYYNLPLGKAAVVQEGEDLTIITYGWAVQWAQEAVAELKDASIEIIDLRTLIPWDRETVFASVEKTGKVLVLQEDTITMGIGAEISAVIAEEKFEYLDGPVTRVGSLDTPVPFNKKLEDVFLGKARLQEKLNALLEY